MELNDSINRRDFIKNMAIASAIIAAKAMIPGVLFARESDFKNLGDLDWKKTPCRFCGVGCGLLVAIKDDKAVAVKGDPQSPVNKGLCCVKGYHSIQMLYAKDRLTTIKTAAATNAKPSDLASPGHVFPLRANADGVFARRGHTEGSIDLMKLSGLSDSSVLCELTNIDGTMSRLPEIITFAKKHNMPVVTIEDIYQYRKMIAI